jgi:hypothetical protein
MKTRPFVLTSHFLLLIALLLFCSPLVVHAQWEPDRRLTFDGSSSCTPYNNGRCIAAGPHGTLHVGWTDNRDGNYEIYYKRSTDQGTTWSQDSRITNDPAYSDGPSISSSDSIVHLVWYDMRMGFLMIYYKRSTDWGVTWSQDTCLSSGTVSSYYPSLSSSDSTVHVVWEDWRDANGNSEIYYKRSTDWGVTWSPDTRLTQDSVRSEMPSIAISGSDVHVAWFDELGSNTEIYYKRSTDGGTTWSSDVRMTCDSAWSMYPSIASEGTQVHLAWADTREQLMGGFNIYYKSSTDRGITWSEDTSLTNHQYVALYPSIATSGSNVHVAWEDGRDVGKAEIYYKHSMDQGLTWFQDIRLTYDPDTSELPHLALSDSMVHLVWWDHRDGNDEIYYKRNPTGNMGTETAEARGPRFEVRITVKPNPFTSFATVPGHSTDRFTLYDVSGRRVGTYRGGRIGEGLRAGVYFVRVEKGKRKLLRVVKIR